MVHQRGGDRHRQLSRWLRFAYTQAPALVLAPLPETCGFALSCLLRFPTQNNPSATAGHDSENCRPSYSVTQGIRTPVLSYRAAFREVKPGKVSEQLLRFGVINQSGFFR